MPCDLEKETKIDIVKQLFPYQQDSEEPNNNEHRGTTNPFNMKELRQAANRIKVGRAPGPDKIIPEAIKITTQIVPEELLQLYNNLLE